MEQIHIVLVPTIQFDAPIEMVGRPDVGISIEFLSVDDEYTKCHIWIDVDHTGSRIFLATITAKYIPDFDGQCQAIINAISENKTVSQRIAQFVKNYDYVHGNIRRNKQKIFLS